MTPDPVDPVISFFIGVLIGAVSAGMAFGGAYAGFVLRVRRRW